MDSQTREKSGAEQGSSERMREQESQRAKPAETREIKQKASEVLGASESVEGQEGVELSEGKVAESASEDKAHAPAAKGGKTYSADEIEAIRAKLLAALPPQEVMIREIRKKLVKEEKVLTKRMKKLQKRAHTHAFQLTIVVAQLRKIREFFSMLAHATYEMVKHLWLKIVHGV